MARLKKHLGKIILPVLIAATAFFLFRYNELDAVVQTVREANPFFLVAGLAIMLLFVVSEGFAIRALLAALGYRYGFLKCIQYAFIGFYYSSITPSATGGQPVQVYYMTKNGGEAGDSSLCIMGITVAYQAGMLLICAFAFLVRRRFLMENLGTMGYFVIPGAAMCVAVLCAVIGSALRVDWMKRAVAFLIRAISKTRLIHDPQQATETVNAQLEKYAQGAGLLIRKPGTLLLAFTLTVLQIVSRLSVAIVVYYA
ncbi:MAG TPA: lysylphosphatidylglycerol synthase transmembrane domain-containing protein, partial [Clostridia bacterium]|nr:lysylphosphatidylglycerol synthase transmembrane domain-containing protein [Clostridia bacterium]